MDPSTANANSSTPVQNAAAAPVDPNASANLASGNVPAAPQASVDPFGLWKLLEKTNLIVKEAQLDPEVESGFCKVLRKDLFEISSSAKPVDPQALAQVMAQSPVITQLLERRAKNSLVLAGTLKREDFNLVGAIYAYARLVMQDKLLAADLTLLHAGEKGLNLRDIADKLLSFYKRLATEPDSILKNLLQGEFADSNVTSASAITAGLIAPLIIARHHIDDKDETNGNSGFLQRVGGFFNKSKKIEVPREVADLGVIEALSREDADLLKELSVMRAKPRTPDRSQQYSQPSQTPDPQYQAPPVQPRRRPDPVPAPQPAPLPAPSSFPSSWIDTSTHAGTLPGVTPAVQTPQGPQPITPPPPKVVTGAHSGSLTGATPVSKPEPAKPAGSLIVPTAAQPTKPSPLVLPGTPAQPAGTLAVPQAAGQPQSPPAPKPLIDPTAKAEPPKPAGPTPLVIPAQNAAAPAPSGTLAGAPAKEPASAAPAQPASGPKPLVIPKTETAGQKPLVIPNENKSAPPEKPAAAQQPAHTSAPGKLVIPAQNAPAKPSGSLTAGAAASSASAPPAKGPQPLPGAEKKEEKTPPEPSGSLLGAEKK